MQGLLINNLNKNIKGKDILKNINLNIDNGKIYALVGSNGAGKTTVFKCIMGLTAYIGNINLNTVSKDNYLRNIGTLVDFSEDQEKFTIKEIFEEHFVYMNMDIKDLDNYINSLLEKVGLSIGMDTKISSLSLGMKQKLNIALAISHKPKILLLDEPFNGLDRSGVKILKNIMIDFKNDDNLVLVSSHTFKELDDFVEEVIIIEQGRLVGSQNIDNFKNLGIKDIDDYYEKVVSSEY
ncbi:ABC transporter ATP-binding protein [Enterococcus faecalis]|uniref:ABC transporter ATP-binding protein n=1 Tax=Enterococcus faecalis TaxID=1351 RepID=UPI0021E93317|nr:ABC transporter ATP-binding protein [Enterococcus faecalis]MCV3150553.1 ABC transporter ATP-binding protein [Enterococcus faecalis]MCV3171989.1 ABC transporter ATP-binding protein [Enterococcus faecalis]